jgi:hypothetical protein
VTVVLYGRIDNALRLGSLGHIATYYKRRMRVPVGNTIQVTQFIIVRPPAGQSHSDRCPHLSERYESIVNSKC